MNAKRYFLLLLFHTILSTGIHAQEWQQIRAGAANGVTALPGGGVLAVVGGVAYRSTDAGESWITGGGLPTDITALRVHPNGTIYSGSFFGRSGLVYSTDGGSTWSSYNNISAWDVGFNSKGHIFAATEGMFLLRSTDNGLNWYGVQGAGDPMWSIAVASDDHIYAGTQFGGLYHSTDDGSTWSYLPQDAPAVVDGLAVAEDGTIYMSGAVGLGVMNGPLPLVGFYRSIDQGATWEDISPVDSVQVGKNIAVSPSGTLYIGASYPRLPNGVVLMSTDRGEHWQTLSEEIGWGRITGIALDQEGRLYVTTANGVYMRQGVSGAAEPEKSAAGVPVLSIITDPNGTDSFIRTTMGGNGDAGLQVIDMSGSVVRDIPLGAVAGEHRVGVSDLQLAPGLYLFRYTEGSYSETAKVVVR